MRLLRRYAPRNDIVIETCEIQEYNYHHDIHEEYKAPNEKLLSNLVNVEKPDDIL